MKRLSIFLICFALFNCVDEPLEPEQLACVEAATELSEAMTNYNTATLNDYLELCNDYKIALENKKVLCGDAEGNIQILIDDLEDCLNAPLPIDCASAELTSAEAAEVYNDDVNNVTNCNTYKIALNNQMTLCGDASGDIQTIIDGLEGCANEETGLSIGCDGNFLTNIFGQITPCSYDSTENLPINNVYISHEGPEDVDGDGIDDHFSSYLYVTDGTAVLDVNDDFVSFENRTYMYSINVMSLGTTGFQPSTFKPYYDVGVTEPTLGLPTSSYYFGNDCDNSMFFDCFDGNNTINGVVTVSGSPGSYVLCFDMEYDFDYNCFHGNYTGDFILITVI